MILVFNGTLVINLLNTMAQEEPFKPIPHSIAEQWIGNPTTSVETVELLKQVGGIA